MATKRKKVRLPVGLPRIPARVNLKNADDVRRTMFGINCMRSGLAFQVKDLERKLTRYENQIGDKRRLDTFKRTLKSLRTASNLLNNIECAGPYMSFELPYLTGAQRAEAIPERFRTLTGAKRAKSILKSSQKR